ncbi:gamma-glutamylcyclotransferase family protein [Thiohalorhabdus methylotrophus]|uniref:Gamma-glutamylcyclotransferase family protein n=1 Tax=Thiohalorhabdus methylotrophus TaxID=3242694 RepID=A0ABV4TZM0_9GAMM
MSTLHYLAFGSNLHPLRLGERVPSARLLGRVDLSGYQLAFHKRGYDGSGKGNLVYTGDSGDRAFGALFEIAAGEKPDLDAVEGEGYRDDRMEVQVNGRRYSAFVYLGEEDFIEPDLPPYDWYRDIVWHGARYQGAPADYLDRIAAVSCMADPDPDRRARCEALLARLK